MSRSGRSAITTPAAWVLTFRTVPSSLLAKSIHPLKLGVFAEQPLELRLLVEASSSEMFKRVGISLVTWSTRESGMLRTRPTSLSDALAAIVPNVPICATFSAPYFSRT